MGTSVTARVKQVKQPYGGFIRASSFETTKIEDGIVLNDKENINGNIIGMCVDYLSRFSQGIPAKDAFSISLQGALLANVLGGVSKSSEIAFKLMNEIKGLDDNSIINACKLVTFDVWLRNPYEAMLSKTYEDTNPDEFTIKNIQTLVRRCLSFFEMIGGIKKEKFTFEPPKKDPELLKKMKLGECIYGGYTPTVSSGDGDFLSADTMWDLKIVRSPLNSKHTLQLLMYWIMGQHSGQEIYRDINKIGFFNPRSNEIKVLDMKKVPEKTIQYVEKNVICYPTT